MNNAKSKQLPAITICSLAGFKQRGLFYKVGDLINNSYGLDEIINNATYIDALQYIYEEPISQQMGRCFSYHETKEYDISSGYNFYFKENQGPYSQHFILFETYNWTNKLRVFFPG